MPDFVQTAVKEIDEQLRALKDEASRLEAARAALSTGTRRQRPQAGNAPASASPRPAGRRNRRAAVPRLRSDGQTTRAHQAVDLVRDRPGITIPEIAAALKIQPNYLYRVLPRLASSGAVKRDGQGWYPPSSSSSTSAAAATKPRRRAQTRAATSAPTPRPSRARKTRAAASANGTRSASGGTRASVLAALAGGEAMTAGQVATKAGLGRPTVSTTLSKLAKTGAVQKAERGYRLPSAA